MAGVTRRLAICDAWRQVGERSVRQDVVRPEADTALGGPTLPKAGNDDATRWRLMALEVFAIAHHMTDPECRATMLRIATGYDRLAERAEKDAPDPIEGPSSAEP
jgi:hypothetical protein